MKIEQVYVSDDNIRFHKEESSTKHEEYLDLQKQILAAKRVVDDLEDKIEDFKNKCKHPEVNAQLERSRDEYLVKCLVCDEDWVMDQNRLNGISKKCNPT